MAKTVISIPSFPHLHLSQIQYIFKVLKTDFTIQYVFNTVWEPRTNPDLWSKRILALVYF